MYRLLWMRLRGEMIDGFNRCTMHGEISDWHKNRSNRMKKRRNTRDGLNREAYCKDS